MAAPRSPKKKSTATRRALPAALAKRAEAQHAARRDALAARGFEAIALIQDLRRHISGDYLAIGKALAGLRQDGMADALGCADFREVCAKHFQMSAGHADRLIRLAEHFERAVALQRRHAAGRTVALDLGYERACALLALADATPEDDTPEALMHATLTLPSGERLVVDEATTEQLFAAAKSFRQARAEAPGAKDKGGRSTTPAERVAFRALQRDVAADARWSEVKLVQVARGRTRGAMIRADVPQALWQDFVRAMAKRK